LDGKVHTGLGHLESGKKYKQAFYAYTDGAIFFKATPHLPDQKNTQHKVERESHTNGYGAVRENWDIVRKKRTERLTDTRGAFPLGVERKEC
jgi:hypothetical protein